VGRYCPGSPRFVGRAPGGISDPTRSGSHEVGSVLSRDGDSAPRADWLAFNR